MATAHATSRYIRTSAQKAGLVLAQIRGVDVTRALATLRFSRKLVARDIEKTLRSAIANVQQRDGFGGDVDRLYSRTVLGRSGAEHEAHASGADGPGFRIVKRMAHLTVEVAERPVARPRPASRPGPERSDQAREGRRGAKFELRSSHFEVEDYMGQKVHPYGFRLGFNKTWRSRWYADKDYAKLLPKTSAPRGSEVALRARRRRRIDIERAANKLKVDIHTSRPGIIIGRKGTEVDKLRQELHKSTGREVFINILEIQKPELDAQLIGESVAMQLEKRVAFRRAMRKAVESALRFGARGIKVRVSGRLNGAEIARSEWYCTASCRCRRCGRTSTTGSPRRSPPTARLA